jgi:glycerophosphoryl diester phosphodiesterase
MSWLDELPQPVIYAHRGASAYAPENTLAAFRLALEHGAPAIELDVKLTADRQVVVMHDQTVDRTTSGHGDLRNFTFKALRELDAGSFFSAQYAGERIPSLAEVFESVGKLLYINIELTNYASPMDGLVDRVAALVSEYGMVERVLFSSFRAANLKRIQQILPQAPRALLAGAGFTGALAREFIGPIVTPLMINPYFANVTDGYMRRQKKAGRRVNVWTVDDPLEMRRLLTLGVGGIITNDPRLARQTLGL